MAWKRISLLTLTGALAAGCGDDRGSDTPEPIQSRLTLQGFGSCTELEQYIEDVAVRDMKQQLDAQKDGGWGFRGGLPEAAGAEDSASKASGPSAYTTTNTQVAGVDEADFMKNDGTRIFVLSGGTLYAAKSWPPADMALAGKLAIEGYPSQMYLDDKSRVVVFSSVYSKWWDDDAASKGESPCADWGCGYAYSNTTKVTVVDVSTLAAPKVSAEYYLPGSYSNSRRIGSSVRLVLSDSFRWPSSIRFYPEYSQGLYEDKVRLGLALDELKRKNEALIRARTLEQWLPKARRRLDSGELVEVQYNCADFSRSNAPVHLGLLTVATLNLDKPASDPSRTSIVGESGEIYASQSSLYVTNRHWWWWPLPGQMDYTYVHKFDIQSPDKALYVASGGVEGYIVDQFSMDEDKGFFRLATTISSRVPDTKNPENRWGVIETTNRVSVLGEQAGSLRVLGRSEEIAKGERIYSSRFIGDRGYVVTFRQVDPFYTFDMSDPKSPRKVGELKIPGFSSYIHPIDADHVLTLGTYMPEPDAQGHVDWQQRRLQLSVFDVSNFAAPVQKFTHTVGTAYGWTEAQYEHKAFNFFPQRKLLAIPFWDYNPACANAGAGYWGCFTSEVRVFDVDAEAGIRGRGALSMKDVYQTYNDSGWAWYWSPYVRRSVMATDSDTQPNDFVYAVSDAGLRVANLNNLQAPLATVRFNKAGK